MAKSTIILDEKILKPYRDIENHLRFVSRFSLPTNLEKIISTFCETNYANKTQIAKGAIFYRSRIHDFQQQKPFDIDSMGAPPRGVASSGRINPHGIPYLYCSYEKQTAISEVRPWKGATLSVGKFQINRDIEIIDLSDRNVVSLSFKLDQDLNETDKAFGQALVSQLLTAHYFSQPTHNSDEHAYLASQYISEKIKLMGVDAIAYPSVLNSEGKNICFFSLEDATCSSVEEVNIDNVSYSFNDKTNS
ncbi:RES family NAD+ phosphorylase [Marinicella sp. W31]|uniref:RES family NAD+ phosphorylase n=1 Tax=Marinicella sp. W31 TaxID=3023713 RepID=UPI00375646B1